MMCEMNNILPSTAIRILFLLSFLIVQSEYHAQYERQDGVYGSCLEYISERPMTDSAPEMAYNGSGQYTGEKYYPENLKKHIKTRDELIWGIMSHGVLYIQNKRYLMGTGYFKLDSPRRLNHFKGKIDQLSNAERGVSILLFGLPIGMNLNKELDTDVGEHKLFPKKSSLKEARDFFLDLEDGRARIFNSVELQAFCDNSCGFKAEITEDCNLEDLQYYLTRINEIFEKPGSDNN